MERYDLHLTNNDLYNLRDTILAGKAILLGKESCNKTHWLVKYKDVELIAVFDRTRRMIATFLDMHMASNNDYIDKNLLTKTE